MKIMHYKKGSILLNRAWALALAILLSLIAASPHLAAQGKGNTTQTRKRSEASSRKKRRTPATPVDTVPRPLVYESKEAGDPFRSGDVYVRATENSHMTVPIGMSKDAPVLVEFIADDPLYSFHEGNKNLAYVDCGQDPSGEKNKCRLRPTDPLVLEAGDGFIPPVKGKPLLPSTTITVQRVSGMVISFVIYFVSDPSKNANRVVVSYNLREVLEARRAAGLMTQLVSADYLAQAGVPTTSPLVNPNGQPSVAPATPPQPQPVASPTPREPRKQNQMPQAQTTPSPVVATSNPEHPLDPPELDTIAEATISALKRAATTHAELQFLKPVHGLSLAVMPGPPPVSNVTVQVIALRNTLDLPLRLLPDQPDLRIASAAKKGEAVLDQNLPVAYVATTIGEDNVLQPGKVYYFAIAYEPPALGVKQSLYAQFAHMLAADEPASAPLSYTLSARKEEK